MVDLSIDVFMGGEWELIGLYLKKLSMDSHSEAWSYLLYRFLHRLRKRNFDYQEYDAVIKLLFEHGAQLSYKVTKRRSILAWAVISEDWDLVRCLLMHASSAVLRELNQEGILTEQFDGKRLVSFRRTIFETIEETAPRDILGVLIRNGCGNTKEGAESPTVAERIGD